MTVDQTAARNRAKELGGIATTARRSKTTGEWLVGGWDSDNETWIVISAYDPRVVLDDGEAPE
jgi:hypothetical protein